MRPDRRTDVEGMLDDRQCATGVGAVDLELDPDPRTEAPDTSATGLDDLQRRSRDGFVDGHADPPSQLE
jgi:hypothetical protein